MKNEIEERGEIEEEWAETIRAGPENTEQNTDKSVMTLSDQTMKRPT